MDTPDYTKSVSAHYGGRDLREAILEGLRARGKDPDNLHYTDVATMDHFHTRGRAATLELAEMALGRSGQRVLDVGGGLGGPARMLAAEYGCHVTVLDLSESFCQAGEMLTERSGLSDRVSFKVGDALDMSFEDASFDIAWTQHSSMNIADKERLYSEIHRVLRPGGRLAMHEIVAGPVQPIYFPVPWAPSQEINFLRPPDEIRSIISNLGFREFTWIDVTQLTLAWRKQRGAVAAAEVASRGGSSPTGTNQFPGPSTGPSFQNLDRSLEEGRIVVVEAVFDKV
jgi:SAM-dependent methyltransferase